MYISKLYGISLYQFREWIEYFCEKYGRQYIAVPPHYTSQNCSSCGVKVKKSLSTRTHKCSCGCELQRDVNAAINILVKGTGGHPETNARGVATFYSTWRKPGGASGDGEPRIPLLFG